MRSICFWLMIVWLTLGGTVMDAVAADLFTVKLTIDDETQNLGFVKAEDALRAFENVRIKARFPNYNDMSLVLGMVNYRGLHLTANFLDQYPTHLVFHVPSLKIEEEFRGQTRDESVDMFVDFMKSKGGEILQRIQRELARVSPVDPTAGNPNSLQSTLVKNAFDTGVSGTTVERVASGTTRSARKNLIGLGVSGGTFKAGAYNGSNITLPLSYAIEFGEGSRPKQLQLNLPLTYIQVEGADVFTTSPGVALTLPVGDAWSVTPAVTYGITGSVDVGSVGQMIGGTFTSRYEFMSRTLAVEDMKVVLGNMIGYVSTLKFSMDDFEYDPGIVNTVYKNGLSIESPLKWRVFDEELLLQLAYAHTYFSGTKLFLNQYHEAALSVASGWVPDWISSDFISDLRLGVTYTFGEDYSSLTGNLGYSF